MCARARDSTWARARASNTTDRWRSSRAERACRSTGHGSYGSGKHSRSAEARCHCGTLHSRPITPAEPLCPREGWSLQSIAKLARTLRMREVFTFRHCIGASYATAPQRMGVLRFQLPLANAAARWELYTHVHVISVFICIGSFIHTHMLDIRLCLYS